ncbi:MAG: GPW/gp25 family protein [Treponema sp.]|jgi:type VI secretion system lysozyme-like protein|nr:GPW/gp25 family protein [Treponema sp.]
MARKNSLTKEQGKGIPCILKRLTDFEPAEKSERPETMAGEKQFRDDIFENIEMLFNSRSHAALEDLKGYQDAADSVLGYGIMDFCGRQSSSASREALRDHIFNQLCLFEPRLDPASIAVDPHEAKGGASEVAFRISGLTRPKELEGEIALMVKLDLESGIAETRREHT